MTLEETQPKEVKKPGKARPERKRKPYFTGRHASIPEFLTDQELEDRNKRKFQYMKAAGAIKDTSVEENASS